MDSQHQYKPQQHKDKEDKPKKLRFITNHGAPHPKRRRVSAACMTCRRRKVACSGERPACNTCSQNKIECGGYDAGDSSSNNSSSSNINNSNNDSHSKFNNSNTTNSTKTKPPKDTSYTNKPKRESLVSQDDSIPPPLSHNRPLQPQTTPSFAQSSQPSPLHPAASVHRHSVSSVGHGTTQPATHASGQEEGILPSQHGQDEGRRSRLPDITEETSTSGSGSTSSLFAGPRNRMPYFRWLGPTAIMPGFKQMVVKVKRRDTSNGLSSNRSTDGPASPAVHRTTSIPTATPIAQQDMRPDTAPMALPFYDTSSMPPSELITHLAITFFTHLGCNFPFLQRDRFLRDLEEKQVDAILVDAVCALAARFSNHHLLTHQHNADDGESSPSEFGTAFASRAKEALIHTFATPSVAAVQAALLLAYNEFGESRDSGLWMYLGISIRLAQDLGMQKLDGLCYEGRDGPTPKMVKSDDLETPSRSHSSGTDQSRLGHRSPPANDKDAEEQRAVERERIDTFWAVFFLDRVVSSGTGRRSTLRDKDIELSFPSLETDDPKTGWPSPFPALIRIVHLYGRVADLLNGIKESGDITEDTPRRLADMEARVTNFYQGLSLKLHFQAMNFHHYVKAGEGTNFVLLHFWFHTLIVLLHQPTLFKTFEGKMLQLFPNSQQLSMSSAKTIADILSYSQLIDTKASLGNPFTTQPIYIAACAFLKETAEQSATSKEQSRTQSRTASRVPSRASSPKVESQVSTAPSLPSAIPSSRDLKNTNLSLGSPIARGPTPLTAADRLIARHTLLATAASQHYQLCYKALESLETYWAGTKYILTVLDQKFKGVGDPLLYTAEEGESSLERPNPKAEEAFKLPGWRRKLNWGGGPNYIGLGGGMPSNINFQGTWLGQPGAGGIPGTGMGRSAQMSNGTGTVEDAIRQAHDPNSAIGWTLTGTLNSPSTNLAWHYPSMHNQDTNSMLQGFDFGSPLNTTSQGQSQQIRSSSMGSMAAPPQRSHFDNNILLDPTLPYSTTGASINHVPSTSPYSIDDHPNHAQTVHGQNDQSLHGFAGREVQGLFGDMLIESQDVDTSLLGLDTLPWFDTLPGDLGDFDMPSGGGVVADIGAQPALRTTDKAEHK